MWIQAEYTGIVQVEYRLRTDQVIDQVLEIAGAGDCKERKAGPVLDEKGQGQGCGQSVCRGGGDKGQRQPERGKRGKDEVDVCGG